jgi:beta-mannosidase
MKAHQKAFIGKEKLHRGLDLRFPGLTENFDAWHYLTQLEQARALNIGIRHLRSHHDVSAGSVIWQLNDCWPVVSWAMIDFEGKRKPAWHVVRKAYAPRIVSFSKQASKNQMVLVNDTDQPWKTTARLTRAKITGLSEVIQESEVEVPKFSHLLIPVAVNTEELDVATEFLVADAGDDRSLMFLGEDSELAYDKPQFELSISETEHGVKVIITAQTLVRELCLFVDRVEDQAEISDQAITLLSGESATVFISTTRANQFTESSLRQVARSANEYRSLA